jgi:hypothetical protein
VQWKNQHRARCESYERQFKDHSAWLPCRTRQLLIGLNDIMLLMRYLKAMERVDRANYVANSSWSDARKAQALANAYNDSPQ